MKLSAVVLASALIALVGMVATADTVTNADSRNVIAVDANARAKLLTEMRGHLVNLQALLEALSEGDMNGVTQAARASGVQSASESADDIIAHLPSGFTALGMSMHRDFDRIADMAARGSDAQTLLRQVAVTMQKCVACHTTYKFGVGARTALTR